MKREVESKRSIIKNKILIYQSKANLDETILVDKINHHLDPEFRQILVKSILGNGMLTTQVLSV